MAGGQPAFPPSVAVEIKSLACQKARHLGLPLSRLSISDIQREVIDRGIVASIGATTIWRWLGDDAIQPWRHRMWIFPRDPNFAEKAGPILDLYSGSWEGTSLGPDDYVISTDEKTSIQARKRIHETVPTRSGSPMLVEHEYERRGAWAYLAAWDVRRARVFGRCERKTGIVPFLRLVRHVMSHEPYRSAARVFWIMDNGSSHRGDTSDKRLRSLWPNIVPVHTPVHASWLNQVEIYFSIVQRKVLTPNDFPSLASLERALLGFQHRYERMAKPFEWKFTREDLRRLLARLHDDLSQAA